MQIALVKALNFVKMNTAPPDGTFGSSDWLRENIRHHSMCVVVWDLQCNGHAVVLRARVAVRRKSDGKLKFPGAWNLALPLINLNFHLRADFTVTLSSSGDSDLTT